MYIYNCISVYLDTRCWLIYSFSVGGLLTECRLQTVPSPGRLSSLCTSHDNISPPNQSKQLTSKKRSQVNRLCNLPRKLEII